MTSAGWRPVIAVGGHTGVDCEHLGCCPGDEVGFRSPAGMPGAGLEDRLRDIWNRRSVVKEGAFECGW